MPTIDLSTPPPPPDGTLDALPRRVSLTLPELQLAAERAGGAPLPFDLEAPDERPGLEARLGESPGSREDQAYRDALAALHDPVETLSRRRLLVDDQVDEGMLGAVGLLATPELALDLDIAVGGARARAWHRRAGGAVATLATADGIVFELAWFPTDQWSGELARVAEIPEDVDLRESNVPDGVSLPYELLDAAVEALAAGRVDVLPVLTAQHAARVVDAGGTPVPEADIPAVLTALQQEAHGRLRGLVADVSGETTTLVGVVSWSLLADGWRTLRPRPSDDGMCVDIVAVGPDDLGQELAPVMAAVSA